MNESTSVSDNTPRALPGGLVQAAAVERIVMESSTVGQADPPEQIFIAPWGEVETLAGSFILDQEAATATIEAFTAPEIDDLAKRSGLPWNEVLSRFKEAGLNGMPGGGAEIFDPEVRLKICPKKISAEEWLGIHRVAHGLGIRTNATMLYGHIETGEQRVAHLLRLRDLQDETHGFSAFVPLPYHP